MFAKDLQLLLNVGYMNYFHVIFDTIHFKFTILLVGAYNVFFFFHFQLIKTDNLHLEF